MVFLFHKEASAHPSQQQLDRLTKAGLVPTYTSQDGTNQQTEAEKLTTQSVGMGVDSYAASKPQWNMASPISTESPSTATQSEIQPISNEPWVPTTTWVSSWKAKLPLQTIMRLLQVCIVELSVR